MTQKFSDFNIDDRIIDALTKEGITTPFPIQALTLPIVLEGQDIIGQAQTGTGKTLGFSIPILQKILETKNGNKVSALVIVPTRELATQVTKDINQAAANTKIKTACIYGGRSYEPQIKQLKRGAQVVVATPGRLLDLHNQGLINFNLIETIVLDEADRLLDLGFLQDIERVFELLPDERQTMLFSATMAAEVMVLARKYLQHPTHIRAEHDETTSGAANENIEQFVYRCHAMDKDEVLGRLLQNEKAERIIIFTNTKRVASKVVNELKDRGFDARPLHGDLNQDKRERTLNAFRKGRTKIVVATDVAARGIDVDEVSHVINYECPDNEETYVHRIGRTGRAGNVGTAVTFVDWKDMPKWSLVNKALKLDNPEPVETYSTSEHLFAELSIPKGTKGRIKAATPKQNNNKTHHTGRRNNKHNRNDNSKRNNEQKPRRNRQRKRRVIRHNDKK
ncbi:MAG: DEAD/DEAH box helicase [Micrococcaceae bacterium]